MALQHDLPIVFHVREAFDDFWEVIDSYRGVRAAVHSFTDSEANLEKALERGFMVGINGIATFSSSQNLDVIYRTVPQQSMLLETDAPYLTPVPYRGTMCEPGHVRVVAEHLCRLRGDSLADLAAYTTANAKNLFHL